MAEIGIFDPNEVVAKEAPAQPDTPPAAPPPPPAALETFADVETAVSNELKEVSLEQEEDQSLPAQPRVRSDSEKP